MYQAMTASLNSAASSNTPSANINVRIPSSSSSSSSKPAFSPSNYPGPPPTVRVAPVEGPLRFGGGNVSPLTVKKFNLEREGILDNGNCDTTESVWRMCGGQLQDPQQQHQQQKQHHPEQKPTKQQHSDLTVKIRRKPVDGVFNCASSKTGVVSANRITPLDFGAANANCPILAPLPSASALNASLQAASTPLTVADGKDAVIDATAAALKNAAARRRPSKKTNVSGSKLDQSDACLSDMT